MLATITKKEPRERVRSHIKLFYSYHRPNTPENHNMPEQQRERDSTLFTVPTLGTVVRGTATLLTVGMIVSAGFALYHYVSEPTPETEEEEVEEED
jgi:hypothetical protein